MVLVVVGWGQRPPKLIRESAWVGQAALVEKRSKRLPGSDRVRGSLMDEKGGQVAHPN